MFSTAGLGDSITSASLSNLGAIPSAGTLQQFVFTMKITASTITSTVGALTSGAGLVILTNPNVVYLSMDDSPTVVTSNDASLTKSIGLYSTVS